MNKTKQILIILSIVLALGDLAWSIYYVATYFMLPASDRVSLFYVIFEFIDIVAIIAEMVLLSLAVWGNGKYFVARHGLYVTAFMIAVIFNLLSISTVLLIVSMFVSNVAVAKETEEIAPGVEVIEETKEEKIIRLRKNRDDGKISQEEFEKQMAELL